MKIIFSGGNHIGVGALKSIQKYFDVVYILDSNPVEILELKRERDVIIKDFSDSDSRFVFLGGHTVFISEEQLKEKVYINVHGALLPKYRGMHSTFWAIMNGEKQLGVTFHLVDKYMDSGPIIAQFSFNYLGQTVHEINQEIDRLIEQHAGEIVYNYIIGAISPVEQNHEEATFGCRRNLEDCLVDYNMENIYMERFFKALTYPYPLPRIKVKGKVYEVVKHKIVENRYYLDIGRVVNISDEGVWIKTKEGFLIIGLLRDVETADLVDPKQILRIGYRFIK